MKLFMMVGLPASGKSFYAEKVAIKEKAIVISTDEIREEFFGSIRKKQNQSKVFYEVYSRIEKHLSMKQNVVLDATNLDRNKRIYFLSKFPNVKKIACYVDTPYEICIKRNNHRKRCLENWILEKSRKALEIPQLSEGFDELIVFHEPFDYGISKEKFVSLLKEEKGYDEIFESLKNFPDFFGMKDFNQENPYHSLTLSKHTYGVLEYLNAFYDEEDKFLMQVAALFHDIGKPFCKKFKPLKGHYSYYSHELVSSQIAFHFLTELGFEDNWIRKCVGIIEMHMKIAFGGEKDKSDIYHLLGGDSLTKLYIFNEADRFAK